MAEAQPQPQDDGGVGDGNPPSKLSVRLASGASFPVLNDDEKEYVESHVRLYQEHNGFTNISDLVDLDKVLMYELLTYRWGIWLVQTVDYDGRAFDEDSIRKQSKEWGTELRQLKKTIGIDKLSRDRARGEGSLPHYISELLYRANAMGILRNEQAAMAIQLVQEVIAMATWAFNVEPEEREEFGLTDAHIVAWIREELQPRFEALDAKFRSEEQRYWVRKQ